MLICNLRMQLVLAVLEDKRPYSRETRELVRNWIYAVQTKEHLLYLNDSRPDGLGSVHGILHYIF